MQDFLVQMGEKPFRAKQIFAWVYRGARSFDEMTDISKALRKLNRQARLGQMRILKMQTSKKDKNPNIFWSWKTAIPLKVFL